MPDDYEPYERWNIGALLEGARQLREALQDPAAVEEEVEERIKAVEHDVEQIFGPDSPEAHRVRPPKQAPHHATEGVRRKRHEERVDHVIAALEAILKRKPD